MNFSHQDDKVYSDRTFRVIGRGSNTNKHGFRGYKFRIGDIVRIGRLCFKVRKMSTQDRSGDIICNSLDNTQVDMEFERRRVTREDLPSSPQPPLHTDEKPLEKENSVELDQQRPDSHKGEVCRICLGEEDPDDKDDELISPCLCKGTMKYIHLSCLKNWLV